MVHLNELWEKYKDKGVVVLLVTNEPRGLVDAFVSQTGAKFPIVIETTNSIESYEGKGFPTQVAIGPDGKIIGDSFSEQMIADKSGHNIQRDQPEAAIDAILKMVERVRDEGRR